MRITGGSLRGRVINAPANLPVRPTTDFAKTALFNILNNYFDFETKYARLKGGALAAFVDPEGYKKYVADKEQAFKTELAKQRAALPRSQ